MARAATPERAGAASRSAGEPPARAPRAGRGSPRSLRASGEIGDERVELVLRDRRPEAVRHDAPREARLDVGVRVDDRLPDELLQRLAGPLRLLRKLVQVGPDLPRRAGGLERVAAVAAVAREGRLRGTRSPAATAPAGLLRLA